MEDARKIPNSDWESHKKTIEILYLTENKSLNEVMKTMEESHGFYARLVTYFTPTVNRRASSSLYRKAQYVRKLDQWGFKKNSTHEEWKFVARQLKKRNLEGKRSDTYINGKLIPRKKVMKEVSRYVTSSGQQMPITGKRCRIPACSSNQKLISLQHRILPHYPALKYALHPERPLK